MKLIHLCDARLEPPRIPRSLAASPAYQPDWRFLVVEQHLFEIAKAEDKSVQLEAILVRGLNPYSKRWQTRHKLGVIFGSGGESLLGESLRVWHLSECYFSITRCELSLLPP
jgi:hypothetical protein